MEPIEWKLNDKVNVETNFKRADWGYTILNGVTTALSCPLCGAQVPYDEKQPPGRRFVLEARERPVTAQETHIRYHVAMASYLGTIPPVLFS